MTGLPLNERVFVSRTLNMNAIRVVGFDMDYTLVLYHERKLEDLAFRGAADYLVRSKGYPESLLRVKFDPDRFVRGLVIDKKLGNLVKINRFGYIKTALHGDGFYSRDDVRRIYSNQIVQLTDPRFEMAHTMFSLSTCALFCALVESAGPRDTYEDVYHDIDEALGFVHRQGYLKSRIVASPQEYVLLNPDYAKTLRMIKKFGKKLILATNSEWEFTREMMSYSYDRFMPKGQTWRDLFDLVIVSATKPEFFTERNRFFEVIPESGYLKNVQGKPEAGKIYQGGNASAVEELFGVERGQILYVGDHIYADVLQSKKSSKWRTMLVITELEEELRAAAAAQGDLDSIRKLMTEKEDLELQIDAFRKSQVFSEALEGRGALPSEGESAIRSKIAKLDERLSETIRRYEHNFHPHWGELLWAGNDKSHFAVVLERYACTYTSKVSNLLHYSPVHYFRPPTKTYF